MRTVLNESSTSYGCEEMLSNNANKLAVQAPCILIVDDHPANVLIASTLVEAFGYCYDVATNGQEAVECIKARQYAGVLMDIRMPIMNGLEATRVIRKFEKDTHHPRIAIIAVTAEALKGNRETCLAAGMDEYISKPFTPEELENKLRALIESKNLQTKD